MKNHIKIFNKIIFILIVSALVIIISIFIGYDLLPLPKLEDSIISQFNLIITTNSIIAGFSFTNLGILISLSDTDLVKRLSNTTIMTKKNEILITSIDFCCLSIFISLIFVLRLDTTIVKPLCFNLLTRDLYYIIYPKSISFLYNLSIFSLISGLIYFVKSIKELSNLLMKVYESNNPKITEQDVKLFKKRLLELDEEKSKNNLEDKDED